MYINTYSRILARIYNYIVYAQEDTKKTKKTQDGKGMGFEIHSGSHKLVYKGDTTVVEESSFWQGTIVFIELTTNKEIDPQEVVANRTDCASQYNEIFLNDLELEELW